MRSGFGELAPDCDAILEVRALADVAQQATASADGVEVIELFCEVVRCSFMVVCRKCADQVEARTSPDASGVPGNRFDFERSSVAQESAGVPLFG